MKIYEVHRKVKDNVGDKYCSPSHYFTFPNIISGELLHSKFPVKNNLLIIGGGGLIHKKFQKHIQVLLEKQPAHSVLWGIGHNFGKKHERKSSINPYYPNWIHRCDLIGIRDWIKGYEHFYLPCASCMHPAFDKKYDTKHETVYFLHTAKTKANIKNKEQVMYNNNMNFYEVINFLGSGDTVVTDSYHGAFWAQLLGKKVNVSAWSVKFNYLKSPVAFLENINSKPIKYSKLANDELLEESRFLNNNFYQKFISLI